MSSRRSMSARESSVRPGTAWQRTINALAALAEEVHRAGDRAGAEGIINLVYSAADLVAATPRGCRGFGRARSTQVSRDKGSRTAAPAVQEARG